VDFVQIRWPSGLVERFDKAQIDSVNDLKEGSGAPVAPEGKKPS
jgi:hypothetical protein